MTYVIKSASGEVLYEGKSWPMARAALDFYLMKNDDKCPTFDILPDTKE